jgi:hypothetical protein
MNTVPLGNGYRKRNAYKILVKAEEKNFQHNVVKWTRFFSFVFSSLYYNKSRQQFLWSTKLQTYTMLDISLQYINKYTVTIIHGNLLLLYTVYISTNRFHFASNDDENENENENESETGTV